MLCGGLLTISALLTTSELFGLITSEPVDDGGFAPLAPELLLSPPHPVRVSASAAASRSIAVFFIVTSPFSVFSISNRAAITLRRLALLRSFP